ncbi:major capsid protein [Actinoalloteichus sp. GBA129-24]|uniref:major capsid protein n=1 Tax=Actinoalloteichus sp. GBA129-24 TaxID=1612551 RepID=UPI00095096DC|nr:major capsid protein [Actinoalloteichus sp. GBA129-24]APU20943.1 Phage major capsid protein E [Actinoalloteichus sp. GBA129-24]APU24192.1 Phage major capsid protein E [Actinoalloteichus sp. GBA129-24]
MDLIKDYIDPVTLTGFAREALRDLQQNQFTLSRFLSNRTIDDIDFRVNRDQAGLAKTAKYRAYDAESPISGRRGIQRIMGELPPISEKRMLGEYERIKLRRLTSNDPIIASIYNDTYELVLAISARVELARGEALATGRIVLDENGVVSTIDFGRRADHTVVAAVPWSDPASTPLTDLLAWKASYRQHNGRLPGVILTSDRVVQSLMRNEEFRQLAATAVGGTPNIVSQEAMQSTLVAYGLPRMEIYEAQVEVDGTATQVIPEDLVILLPGNDRLGTTLWGTTAEATEPSFGLAEGGQPGIVAGSYRKPDPVSLWTKAAAIVLPILPNPDLSFVASVLSDDPEPDPSP